MEAAMNKVLNFVKYSNKHRYSALSFPAYSITWSMLVRPIPVRHEHVYGPTAKAWEHVQQRLGIEGTILN